MKIIDIETVTVSTGWKNWLFIRVITDTEIYGIGEATINGFIKTTEACVHELKHFAIGRDPREVTAIAHKIIGTIQDAGHIHRLVMAAIEVACWDILGKSLGVPIYQLLGGKVRESIEAYANGWYRAERTPEHFVDAAQIAIDKGFKALKIDPFGTARNFIGERDLQLAYDILHAIRERFGGELKILIDVHCRFTPAEAVRVARVMQDLDLFWWEEPTSAEQERLSNEVAAQSPIRVATGEQFDKVGKFYTLSLGGGISIWQPEPMSLGGIRNTLAVAHIAEANGAWIAPHQSGGPVATAVCLQLAACIPNYLIQEYFDPFNEPWTQDLVTWTPTIDQANGHLSLPDAPGLGIDLNLEVAAAHPYEINAYLDIYQEGWEQRLGQRAEGRS
ncbi:MAG: mandelate racemase/muconate lactonizing enzyme family protein [Anaerolineae bacterium]|nr:mandelate racemase/muconate lactonizing enzyme family protein [Anaerolineae bacterium]